MLLVGLELDLLQVGLAAPELEGALVLAARPEDLLALDRVEVADRCDHRDLLILLHLEIKLFNVLEGDKVIECDGRVGFDLLHEGGYVCLIL